MVQALRAIACLMVVAYHISQACAGPAAITAWPNLSAGVDIFFVISGYVMWRTTARAAGQPHPARDFVYRRAARLIPLYWLLTGIKLSIAAALPSATPHTTITIWNVIASLAFIPARDATGQIRPVLAVGWSLNYEAFFYLLFATVLACRLRRGWVIPPLAALAVAGFFRTQAWPAPLFLANGMVLEFATGMATAALLPGIAPDRRLAAGCLALGLVLLLVLPLAGHWRFLAWGLPAAIMLGGAVCLEKTWGRFVPVGLRALGDGSYAIYLVHPFIIPLMAKTWPGALAALLFSALAGLLMHRYCDAPVQRWLGAPGKTSLLLLKKMKQKDFYLFRPVAHGSRFELDQDPK